MSFLHVHKRRASTQDVFRSVNVCVITVTAVATMERRLALTALLVHGSAFKAGLRGVGGVDLDQASAAFFELVGQQCFEDVPALVQYRSVEPGFLAHVLSGFFNRAPGACRHAFCVQILQNNDTETFGQTSCGTVLPVLPDTAYPGSNVHRAAPRRYVTPGASFSTGHGSLDLSTLTAKSLESGWQAEPLSARQRNRVHYAAIYSDHRLIALWQVMFDSQCKGDVPTVWRPTHGDVDDCAEQRTSVSVTDPANLGQIHLGPLCVQLSGPDVSALKSEGVVDALLSRRWISSFPPVEALISSLQIAQCLFKAWARDSGNPVKVRAQCSHLSALRRPVQRPSCGSLVLLPPVSALLKRQIVDEPTDSGERAELLFLLFGRLEPVAKPASNHPRILGSASLERNTSTPPQDKSR